MKVRNQRLFKYDVYPLEFLKMLIEGGIDGKKKDMYRWVQDNVIEYVRQGMIAEAKYLINFDFENDLTDLNRLYGAALSVSEPLPDRILRISVCKSSFHHRLLSPLHCACINPNPTVLKTFLRICPTFSLPDKNRRNLVHYAAANTNPDIIRFLLANGCDANELDSSRRTPLMIACDLGRIQNVEVLLEHFEKRLKAAKEQSEDEDDGSEREEKFEVDYINFKDRSSRSAL